MQLLNIFHSGGLWILPLICYIGAGICFWIANKSSKSGSWIGGGDGKPLEDGGGNVPIYQTWSFKWGCALVVFGTIILLMIASDYKGV